MLQKAYNTRQMRQAACTQKAHMTPTDTHNQISCLGEKNNMTTKSTWHVAQGREQRASFKDKWQTKGTHKLSKLHQMPEIKRR